MEVAWRHCEIVTLTHQLNLERNASLVVGIGIRRNVLYPSYNSRAHQSLYAGLLIHALWKIILWSLSSSYITAVR
jgi:hypothetical protein